MLSVPVGAAEPARAVLLHARDRLTRALAVADSYEHLVEDDVVQHRRAAGFERFREPARVRAAALDHLRDARAAERADRRVDREAARAARELRRPVDLVALALVVRLHEIRRGHAHRRAVRLGMRAEREPGVVRDVQPLVAVGRPRVRALAAAQQVAELRRSRGPEPEGAVDVEPRAASAATSAIASRSSKAPVFTSPAWPQTIVGPSPSRSSSTRIRP